MGFQFIRRFLEQNIDLSKIHLTKMTRNDYFCRPMMQGEEEKLTRLQNRSFIDAWGFNPNTTEEISYRIHLPGVSPEDITEQHQAGFLARHFTGVDVGLDENHRSPGTVDVGRVHGQRIAQHREGKGEALGCRCW